MIHSFGYLLLFLSFSTLCCFIHSLIISVCVLNLYASNFLRQLCLRHMLNLLTSPSWRCLTSRWWPRSWPGEQVLPSGHWQTAGKYEFSASVNIHPLSMGESLQDVFMLFFSFTLWIQMKHSENLQIFGGIWHSHLTLLLFELAETEDSERSFGERSLFLFHTFSFAVLNFLFPANFFCSYTI